MVNSYIVHSVYSVQRDNDGAQNTDGYFAVERLSSDGSWVTHYSDFDWETEVSFKIAA